MENENARRKIRTKLFNNLVDDGDDDMSATVHQIVELCAWRGERAYRPHDHNNLNEEEIDALIEYLCTNWASWLYVYYLYFVRLKMFIYQLSCSVFVVFYLLLHCSYNYSWPDRYVHVDIISVILSFGYKFLCVIRFSVTIRLVYNVFPAA